MKNLSNYTSKTLSELFKKYNVFFAYDNKQFEEGKKEGLKYVYRGAGMYQEAGKVKEFDKEHEKVFKKAIEQDIKENGKPAIIERELSNYECYYTGDIDDAVRALKDYNITIEEILIEFKKNQFNHLDD